jgi:chaperone required for assembly of F1-ATPase
MSEWKMKRFWKDAAVVEAGGGFAVELDGRPIRTPAKRALTLPTREMAEAMAAEWQAQEGEVRPDTMPVTRTANAAIDKVATQHAEVADLLAEYGDSDLLCYRAERPAELVARETEAWDPLLDWADEALGARLAVQTGVMHQPQDPATLERLSARVHALNAFQLAAFHDLVSLSGSLVMGFAIAQGAFTPEDLWDRSRVDEVWQAEQWGADASAESVAEVKRAAFLHAARMFALS